MKKVVLTLGSVFFIAVSAMAENGAKSIKMKDLDKKLNKQVVYLWEVESIYGKAKGYATSLEKANQMIALVAKDDIATYKLVVSNE
ncbi:MAG: hypothetical protein ACPG6B_06680 [Oceanihabitans sp.]